ncbi:hypothetical protein [Photobacterium sanguinicancri]|uniref:hypothetical protein n=1 Tax=Photobacterium sanguinicancri TaxID=875932 RepID=UPI0026E2CA72|nr:hypothetical protein [Photobacterium sanguinicancri]MDO6501147.1 hypothetical protein [Photobacterium sanguinicancri]
MTTDILDEKKHIQIKPGDIVLMNTNTPPGVIIKLGTVSNYTHVAIAVSYNEVLESTPDKENQDLRRVHITTALKDATSAVVYKREMPLTKSELRKLVAMYEALKADPNKSKYHRGIAGAAGVPAFINVVSTLSTVVVGITGIWFVGAIPYLAVMIPTALFAPKIVRRLSRWLSKKYPDNWFTKELEGSYCSGFVAKAEEALESNIWTYVDRKPYDPRPKDIAYACKKNKMKWVQYDFKDTPTFWSKVLRDVFTSVKARLYKIA